MASRFNNLKRIGEEGFKMLDQAEEKQRCLYHPTKPSIHYLQPPSTTQVQRIVQTPANITSRNHPSPFNQTMSNPVNENTTTSTHYNDHQRRRSTDHMTTHETQVTTRDQSSTGVMDCYEAARRFGGIVVTDYYPNNKKVLMQRGSKAF